VCVKLDWLARSVRHLTALAAGFEALGVGLIVLDQAIEISPPGFVPLQLVAAHGLT